MNREVELIIIAMDEELSSLLNRIKGNYQTIKDGEDEIYSFKKNNKEYLIIRGKIGKVATGFHIGKLSSKYKINRIFNLGTSGAYSNEINIGDVILATQVQYFDIDVSGFGYELGQVPQCPKQFICDSKLYESITFTNPNYKVHHGLVGSSDSFITKKNREVFPLKQVNPLCVEMEAGAVGQCAYLLNIPFIVIRSISDKVYHDDNASTFDSNITLASDNCVDVLLKII